MRRRTVLAASALGLSSLAGCIDRLGLGAASEWPTHRFDEWNTGYNPGIDGVRDAETDWKRDGGGTPRLADGKLYLGEGQAANLGVEGGDASSSEVETVPRWGKATIAGDHAVVADSTRVHCFAIDSGALVWENESMRMIDGSPTVAGGTAFVNSSGYADADPDHVRAFDVASGEERWRYDTGSHSTPAAVADTVFIGSEGGLRAIDARSGTEQFVVPEAPSESASPVVTEELAYVVSRNRDREDEELVVIETRNGAIRWRTAVGSAMTDGLPGPPPIVAGDLVYATTEDGLVALDLADGTVAMELGPGVPAGAAGDVLYATDGGEVYAYDVESGEELWTHATEVVHGSDYAAHFVHEVVPGDGVVYVNAADGLHRLVPTS